MIQQPKDSSPIVSGIISFYCEELHRLVRAHDRGKFLSIFLLASKQLLAFLFTITFQLEEIVKRDANLAFIKNRGYLDYQKNIPFALNAQYFFSFFNFLILFYLAWQFSNYLSKYLSGYTNKPSLWKNLNQQNIQEENRFDKESSIKKYFSFIMAIYSFLIYIPCIFLSLSQLNTPLGISNLILTIALIINDSDYEYSLRSNDFLARQFTYLQTVICSVVELSLFLAITVIKSKQNDLLIIYFILNFLLCKYFSPYYNDSSQQSCIFVLFYLILTSLTIEISLQININGQLLSLVLILLLPLCFRLSQIIVEQDKKYIVNAFQRCTGDTLIGIQRLDAVIRLNFFEDLQIIRLNDSRMVEILNLIVNSKGNSQKKSEEYLGEYQKERLLLKYGKEMTKMILKQQFQLEINQKMRTRESEIKEKLIYFIFLLEFAESPHHFLMVYHELIKGIVLSIKQRQIFGSVYGLYLRTRALLGKTLKMANMFDSSFTEVLNFEQILKQSYKSFNKAIAIKMEILHIMKLKQISASELVSKIESLQNLIKVIRKNINFLFKLHEDSSDLIQLQAFFLENIAFTENDITFFQTNRFGSKGGKDDKYNMDSLNKDRFNENTCIVFAAYQNINTFQISKVSNNFGNIFFLSESDSVIGNSLEVLIPTCFQTQHSQYIQSYFNESISVSFDSLDQPNNGNQQTRDDLKGKRPFLMVNSGDNDNASIHSTEMPKNTNFEDTSARINLKKDVSNPPSSEYLSNNRVGSSMNQQLLFVKISQILIRPVRIDIRVNRLPSSESVGFAAKIKYINQSLEYAIYDEMTLQVLGLTENAHALLFPSFESLNRANLQNVFPFLSCKQEKRDNKLNHPNISHQMSNYLNDMSSQKQIQANKISFLTILVDDLKGISTRNYSSTNLLKSVANKQKKIFDFNSYQFVYCEFSIQQISYLRVKNISYFEFTKIQTINPNESANFILSHMRNPSLQNCYENLVSSSEFNLIIQELDNNALIKSSSFNQFSSSSCLNKTSFIPEETSILDQNRQKKTPFSSQNEQIIDEMDEDDASLQGKNGISLTLLRNPRPKSILLPSKNQQIQNNETSLNQPLSFHNIKGEQEAVQDDEKLRIINLSNYDKSSFNQSQSSNRFNWQNELRLNSPRTSNSSFIDPIMSVRSLKSQSFFPQVDQSTNLLVSRRDIQMNSGQNSNRHQSNINNRQNNPQEEDKVLKIPAKSHGYADNCFTDIVKRQAQQQSRITATGAQSSIGQDCGQGISDNLKSKEASKAKLQNIQSNISQATSRNSSCASAKRQLCEIMANQSTISVIKMINLIGFVCYFIVVLILIGQYIQTKWQIDDQYEDYKIFDWPTTYGSSLSSILKFQNILLMTQDNFFFFESSDRKDQFRTRALNNLIATKDETIAMIGLMENASYTRDLLQMFLEHYIQFQIGKMYNTSRLVGTNSVPASLEAEQYNTTIHNGVILSFSDLYSYTLNIDNGRPEYYMIVNEIIQIDSLKHIQIEMLEFQINEDSNISNSLNNVMIVIIIISALCLGVIVPLYYYIQYQRDIIVHLFGTFSTLKIDALIQLIQSSYISSMQHQNRYTNTSRNVNQLRQEIFPLKNIQKDQDIRKHNISTISQLPRFNLKIILLLIIVFLLLICSPIINNLATQQYIHKGTIDLETSTQFFFKQIIQNELKLTLIQIVQFVVCIVGQIGVK